MAFSPRSARLPRRFTLRLALRVAALAGALLACAWLLVAPGYHAATLLALLLAALATLGLWRHVERGNRETLRFIEAARHADLSQRFDLTGMGSGFDELSAAFTDVMERMRQRSTEQVTEVRRTRALIEHIPVPLLTLHADGAITLQNNAARRLFGATRLTRIDDLAQFGRRFHDAIVEAVPGRRELVVFAVDGVEHQLTLASTEIVIAGRSERLISLQDIQSELDATQAEAWQDLVRVLTHEIMNSITPVTSLAATAADLSRELQAQLAHEPVLSAEFEDLHKAVATVARRANSLLQFVGSYRQITRLAPPQRHRLRIGELFESVVGLARAEWHDERVQLLAVVEPPGLEVMADRDLLEPVLLNLLRNAWQACSGCTEPKITLRALLNRRGNVVLEVEDNGPGVPRELRQKIFVPFFTTREGGSGVGLALARQVMISHGGYIRLDDRDGAGACFSLIF